MQQQNHKMKLIYDVFNYDVLTAGVTRQELFEALKNATDEYESRKDELHSIIRETCNDIGVPEEAEERIKTVENNVNFLKMQHRIYTHSQIDEFIKEADIKPLMLVKFLRSLNLNDKFGISNENLKEIASNLASNLSAMREANKSPIELSTTI
jgi:hypothetical protein